MMTTYPPIRSHEELLTRMKSGCILERRNGQWVLDNPDSKHSFLTPVSPVAVDTLREDDDIIQPSICTYAYQPLTPLHEGLMGHIREVLKEETPKIKKHVIPANRDHHIMLVAGPIATKAIEEVIYANNVSMVLAYEWIKEGKILGGRNANVERLATKLAQEVIDECR